MEKNIYSWNKKINFFKTDDNQWILYSGETGAFIKLSENEKRLIDLYNAKKGSLSIELYEKLRKVEAISCNKDIDFCNAKNFRLMKSQVSHVLTISICPKDFSSSNTFNTLSESLLKQIAKFCESKNQRVVRIIWNSNDLIEIIKMSFLLEKEFSKVNINCYNSLVSNYFNFRERELVKFKKLKFNNLKFLITTENILNNCKFQALLDTCEIIFNFYKKIFYSPVIQLIFEINEQTKEKFGWIKNYFSQRYGEFFQILFSFHTNIYDCPNKVSSEVYENDNEIVNYLKIDENLKNYNRPYLKKIADVFLCYAQYVSSYVIDWNGNVFKCWNDLGIEDKSIFDLKKGIKKHTEIEFSYLISSSNYREGCKQCSLNNQCNGGCISYTNFNCTMQNHLCDFYNISKWKVRNYEI